MPGTVVAVALIGAALLVGVALAVAGTRSMNRQTSIARVQLPARVLRRVPAVAGDVLTVEYPGPDGLPRTAIVMSAYRRGLGATPTFRGWVWVDRDDPTDVMTRPGGRRLHGLLMLCFGVAILLAASLTAAVLLFDRWMDGLGSA